MSVDPIKAEEGIPKHLETLRGFILENKRFPNAIEYEELGLVGEECGQCSCESTGDCCLELTVMCDRRCYADQIRDYVFCQKHQ